MMFTVVIPAYNAEKYLRSALASLQNQSFRDYEVIVVDDGSADSTLAIAKSFVNECPKLTVLHDCNRGPLLARRRGLLRARGKYVIFLDSDDCLRCDALEKINEAIRKTNADIVSFPYTRREGFNDLKGRSGLPAGYYGGSRYGLVKELVCAGRFNNLWGKAIRLCLIDLETSYEMYKGLMHGEDLFQLLPIIDGATSLFQLDDVLYYYRPNDLSNTARYKTSQLDDIVRVNRRLTKYAFKWGDGCKSEAVVGEINQYLYLLKLSELSDSDEQSKALAFSSISNAMTREGVFRRSRSVGMRLDNRILVIALEHKWRALAKPVVHGVEHIKLFGRCCFDYLEKAELNG